MSPTKRSGAGDRRPDWIRAERTTGYTPWPNDLQDGLEHADVPPSVYRVLRALWRLALDMSRGDHYGIVTAKGDAAESRVEIRLSGAELAKRARVNARSVKRAKAELTSAGLVDVRSGAGTLPDTYILTPGHRQRLASLATESAPGEPGDNLSPQAASGDNQSLPLRGQPVTASALWGQPVTACGDSLSPLESELPREARHKPHFPNTRNTHPMTRRGRGGDSSDVAIRERKRSSHFHPSLGIDSLNEPERLAVRQSERLHCLEWPTDAPDAALGPLGPSGGAPGPSAGEPEMLDDVGRAACVTGQPEFLPPELQARVPELLERLGANMADVAAEVEAASMYPAWLEGRQARLEEQ